MSIDLADTLTETLTDTLSIIGEEETGVKSNNVTFQVYYVEVTWFIT